VIDRDRRFTAAQAQVLWVLWLTYGSFYFCRSNLSAALPGIEAELAISKTQMGLVLGALKISYGIGQLINGQLAQRASARRLLAIGMLASAALNVVFGLGTGLYFLLFVWACNGYVQALGWPPTMRVAADWFPVAVRGRAIGLIGTGYQLAGALTFVVSGWAATQFGWRGALYVPAGLLVLSAIHMLVFLRESPPRPEAAAATAAPAMGWWATVRITLANPRLWLLAVALGLLNSCRFGFLDWGVSHLKEVQGSGIGSATLKYSVLPLGGVCGTLLAGWATDRWFTGRRMPVVCLMMICLFALTLSYDAILGMGTAPSIAALAVIGALIFGPQVLLVGTAPVDLARPGTAAAAVGFVNFVGYLGAATGDQVTGYLVERYDWPTAVSFWAACALGTGIVALPLWKAIGHRSVT
jgi:sugar phosphate permease